MSSSSSSSSRLITPELTEGVLDNVLKDPVKKALFLQLLGRKAPPPSDKNKPPKPPRPDACNKLKNKGEGHAESPIMQHRRRLLEQMNTTDSDSDASSRGSLKSAEAPVSENSENDMDGGGRPPRCSKMEELLVGVVVFVDVWKNNKDRSGAIKIVARAMGAEVRDKFTRDVTHVIYKDGSFNTYQKAKLSKVHLVSFLWLDAVKRNMRRVPERSYPALGGTPSEGQHNLSILCSQLQKDFQDLVQEEQNMVLSMSQAHTKSMLPPPSSSTTGSYKSACTVVKNGSNIDLEETGDRDKSAVTSSDEDDTRPNVKIVSNIVISPDSSVVPISDESSGLLRTSTDVSKSLLLATTVIRSPVNEATRPVDSRSPVNESTRPVDSSEEPMSILRLSTTTADTTKSNLRGSTGDKDREKENVSASANEGSMGDKDKDRDKEKEDVSASANESELPPPPKRPRLSPKKPTRVLYDPEEASQRLRVLSSSDDEKERRQKWLENRQRGSDSSTAKSAVNPLSLLIRKDPQVPRERANQTRSDSDTDDEPLNLKKKRKTTKKAAKEPEKIQDYDSELDEQKDLIAMLQKKNVSMTQRRHSQRFTRSSEDSDDEAAEEDEEEQIVETPEKRRSTLDFATKTTTTVPAAKARKSPIKSSIVCTKLHRDEVENFEIVVRKLGRFYTELNVSNKTTHLVVGETKRTINMLKAIAMGCWIVRHDWLLKSNEAGRWLPEGDFEATDFSPAVQECRLQRQAFGRHYTMDIFERCGRFFVTSSTADSPKASDLRRLIELCGGKVIYNYQKADLVIGQFFEGYQCLTPLWVLDCITENKLKNKKAYRIKRSRGSPEL